MPIYHFGFKWQTFIISHNSMSWLDSPSRPAWEGLDGQWWPCLCIWGLTRDGWDELGGQGLCPCGLILQEAKAEVFPVHPLPKPLFESCLLLSHWPKEVTWLNPALRDGEKDWLSAEFVAEGVHGGPGDMDGQLCDLQQGDSVQWICNHLTYFGVEFLSFFFFFFQSLQWLSKKHTA